MKQAVLAELETLQIVPTCAPRKAKKVSVTRSESRESMPSATGVLELQCELIAAILRQLDDVQ